MRSNNNVLLGILVLLTIVIVTIATFSLGCAEPPEVPDNTTNVNETDDTFDGEYIYGDAVVEETDVLILESFPVKVHVEVTGYLPDGCTELEEENIVFDDENNLFTVWMQTKRPADAMCTEAIVPFEKTVALDVYGLEKGVYIVNVNGIEDQFELQTDNIIPE